MYTRADSEVNDNDQSLFDVVTTGKINNAEVNIN